MKKAIELLFSWVRSMISAFLSLFAFVSRKGVELTSLTAITFSGF